MVDLQPVIENSRIESVNGSISIGFYIYWFCILKHVSKLIWFYAGLETEFVKKKKNCGRYSFSREDFFFVLGTCALIIKNHPNPISTPENFLGLPDDW